MRFPKRFARTVVLFFILFVSACGNANPGSEATGVSVLSAEASKEPGHVFADFKPENFSHSTSIEHPYFTLKPGTQFTYKGTTVEDGETIPHKIVFTVTDLTKVIGGVRSVLVWILDYSVDELVEAELAFYAQDNDGNVWYLGEYPEEYEEGQFVDAPFWIHGLQDAKAGIAMLADPKVGMPDYAQGWGPAVDWTDRGHVEQTGQQVCLREKCYEDVLVVAETSASEQGAFQMKFYAPGVGNIKTDWKGSDDSQEKLELAEVVQLSNEALAAVRKEALKVEAHAYEVSKDIYAQTFPAEYPPGTPAVSVEMAEPPASLEGKVPLANNLPEGSQENIVVYAADIPETALYELMVLDDQESPSGKRIGLSNGGDELDPPPENDPNVTFSVPVQNGVAYRCWIHMKVGAPKGKSAANVVWLQFTDAVDASNQPAYAPGSRSYLTAQGPATEGWAWVACGQAGPESLISFEAASGVTTVRIQAGMEGVSFDQFLLSAKDFLEQPPAVMIVEK